MVNEPGQTESKGIPKVSIETKEACETLATKLHDAIKAKCEVAIDINIEEGKGFKVEIPEGIKQGVKCGVIITDRYGNVIATEGTQEEIKRRINGASATKVIMSYMMLKDLYERGFLDLNDLNTKQLPSHSSKVNGKEIERDISLNEYLHDILGESQNAQIAALRTMYVALMTGLEGTSENPMDDIENKINDYLGVSDEENKYIPRTSTIGKSGQGLGNTGPFDVLHESFRKTIEECKSESSPLPAEFRNAFLETLALLPIDPARMPHTFKRQNPDKLVEEHNIREKSGWYADQGDDRNLTSSFLEGIVNGELVYISFYHEVEEVTKAKDEIKEKPDGSIKEPLPGEEQKGKFRISQREDQQKRYLSMIGEAIKQVSEDQDLKLFT
jgi:hypothetical protein